ncbi:hypothetical protein HYS94_00770 [Candidatus Daviesbacteria bacterium]|nr:hypothetical protein [Candidatus Daviesbacteria bacterium]
MAEAEQKEGIHFETQDLLAMITLQQVLINQKNPKANADAMFQSITELIKNEGERAPGLNESLRRAWFISGSDLQQLGGLLKENNWGKIRDFVNQLPVPDPAKATPNLAP